MAKRESTNKASWVNRASTHWTDFGKRASISNLGNILGQGSWSKGGKARAEKLSDKRLSAIARKAANARWENEN